MAGGKQDMEESHANKFSCFPSSVHCWEFSLQTCVANGECSAHLLHLTLWDSLASGGQGCRSSSYHIPPYRTNAWVLAAASLEQYATGENQLPGLRFCHSLPPACIQWLVNEGIHRPRAFVSLLSTLKTHPNPELPETGWDFWCSSTSLPPYRWYSPKALPYSPAPNHCIQSQFQSLTLHSHFSSCSLPWILV